MEASVELINKKSKFTEYLPITSLHSDTLREKAEELKVNEQYVSNKIIITRLS
jgi:hypothetical protein